MKKRIIDNIIFISLQTIQTQRMLSIELRHCKKVSEHLRAIGARLFIHAVCTQQ